MSYSEVHNFSVNEKVNVFLCRYGKTIIEGTARIVRLLSGEDMYQVRFDDEPRKTYPRYVDPRQDQKVDVLR